MLLDSDVLVFHLRGYEPAREWLHEALAGEVRLSVSVVTITELTGGMRSAERHAVWTLLGAFDVLDVTESIARRAGEYRRRYRRSHSGIGLADYLIAATADVHGLKLATFNVRHYPMFRGLRAPFHLPSS